MELQLSAPDLPDDPTDRRAQILDHAIRVIGERGYYGFTVQELAKACGLSNAGLLHHFPSKEQLFLAALQELEARETRYMQPLVQAAGEALSGERAKAAVLEVLRAIVVRSTAQPQRVRFFAEMEVEALDPSHPAHDWWRRREVLMTDLFVMLLGPHVDEPAAVARQLISMLEGLCLRWLWSDMNLDPIVEWDRAIARLLPELATRPPAAVIE